MCGAQISDAVPVEDEIRTEHGGQFHRVVIASHSGETLRWKEIFLQPAFHSHPKIPFLPISLWHQNKWKYFTVINGVLATQWMPVGMQLISKEDIFRKPHHILFWLYADTLNFGEKKKKVMQSSQLCRQECEHPHTHRESQSHSDSLGGDASPEKCPITGTPGLSSPGIQSAGQDCRSISVVSKTTQGTEGPSRCHFWE